MDYENFKSSTITSIREYFGDKVSVTLHPIIKNNNTKLDGLTIEDGSLNITPTLFLNYHYEDYLAGKPLSSVLDDIIASYQSNLPSQNIDLSFFTNYDQVKNRIIFKLVSYSQNKGLLKNLPHFCFLDLAVVFCCFMPDVQNGNATILIHNHHLDFWNITADSLYALAQKNTPTLLPQDLSSMEDVLKSACTDHQFTHSMPQPDPQDACQRASEKPEPPSLYVLSNTQKYYGASVLLYPKVLSCSARLLNSDLYILPSSIHEVLLLPKRCCPNASGLNCIIQEVNTRHVSREEILSDHFYYYDRELDCVTM